MIRPAVLFLLLVLPTAAHAAPCPAHTYRTAAGECATSPALPPNATAICRDGYLSYSRTYYRGDCSSHGGVYRKLPR